MVGEQIRAILGWRLESYSLRPRRRILRDMDQRDVALAAGPFRRVTGIRVARRGPRNVEVGPALRLMVDSGIALMHGCQFASGRKRFSLPHESEQFRVHFVLERRTHSVRSAGINLEYGAFDDFGR